MTQVTVATIRLLGGHPALDFTNTVDSRGAAPGPDVLESFGDLLNWATRLGVIGAAEADALRGLAAQQSEAALARAKALREAVYHIFATRPSAATAELDTLQREVSAAQTMRLLVPDVDGYAWRWRMDDPDTITHRIAVAAVDLLTSPALRRVHVCQGETCRWLFLDTSRSGRRLWCSEATCGTRNRVQRWRTRRRQSS
jgi:predicted RNA-binding Zn ribbon-like protein